MTEMEMREDRQKMIECIMGKLEEATYAQLRKMVIITCNVCRRNEVNA